MNIPLPRVVFWLVPEESQRTRLYSLIKFLAKRHATVAFVPHVTIYSCYRSPQQSELVTAGRLARSFPEVTLKVDALTCGDRLTQALYLNFKGSEELRAINGQLHDNIVNSSDYEFQPHLSLLYQILAPEERAALIKDVALDIDGIHFNEFRVVAIPEQLKSVDDLRGWQTLLCCRLAPCQNADTI